MDFIYSLIDMLPFEWVQYNFMKNALIGIILISPLLGLLGTMVVNNKMSFFSDALGHSALTGIAIGVLIGIDNYIVSMMGFAIVFALLISFVMESEVSSSDTIIGVFSSIGISIGIVLLSFSGGFSKYSSYLIGDILSIKRSEINLLFIVLILVIAIWVVAFNKLLLSSINSDLASSKQCNVKFFKNLFMILIAIVVTVSIKWVGVLMINSLLILPAAASRNIAKNMKEYHIFSVLFSLVSGICGLFISFYLGLAAAGTIVIISAFIFFVTFFMNKTNK
mgnify:FL=1